MDARPKEHGILSCAPDSKTTQFETKATTLTVSIITAGDQLRAKNARSFGKKIYVEAIRQNFVKCDEMTGKTTSGTANNKTDILCSILRNDW